RQRELSALVELRLAGLRALVEAGRAAGRAARRARRILERLVARRIELDRELPAAHPGLLQLLETFLRHAVGQLDRRVRVEDPDAPDVHRVDRRFVRDRADDVAGLHAVIVTHGDSIAHAAARRTLVRGTLGPRTFLLARRVEVRIGAPRG